MDEKKQEPQGWQSLPGWQKKVWFVILGLPFALAANYLIRWVTDKPPFN